METSRRDAMARHLAGLLETAREAFAAADPETVQRATVYSAAAEHLAPLVHTTEAAAFRALAVLCGERWDGADPAVVEALRHILVRITVRYEVADLGPVGREVEIWSGADRSGITRQRIQQRISWDDTPADVRARRLEHGDPAVSFQLYP